MPDVPILASRRRPHRDRCGRAPARGRVGGAGRHRDVDRPVGPRRDRARRVHLPEGEAARLARGPARASARAGASTTWIRRPRDPSAREPAHRGARRVGPRRADALASALAPAGRHVEGRASSSSGRPVRTPCSASGLTGPCSSTPSCTTSRTRSSVPARTSRAWACAMFNVHALGGDAMMRAAPRARDRGATRRASPTPLVIAVTVLSVQSGEGLATPASLAWEAKAAGSTASSCRARTCATCARSAATRSVSWCRASVPRAANGHDQVRVLTPAAAIERGADYLVVGRPITAAADPVGAARAILREAR